MMMLVMMMMMMMSSAGKDGRKKKNKKKDVNTRTKAAHGTNMDVFIDHVGIIIIITAIIVIIIIQGVPIKVRPWLINNISSTNESWKSRFGETTREALLRKCISAISA